DALDCSPSPEQVGTHRMLPEHLGAGCDHDFEHEGEPVGATVPRQDARVGTGCGEFVVATAAVLPPAVVLVIAGQQLWLGVAYGLQPQSVGGVVAEPGLAVAGAGAVVKVQDVVVRTGGDTTRWLGLFYRSCL